MERKDDKDKKKRRIEEIKCCVAKDPVGVDRRRRVRSFVCLSRRLQMSHRLFLARLSPLNPSTQTHTHTHIIYIYNNDVYFYVPFSYSPVLSISLQLSLTWLAGCPAAAASNQLLFPPDISGEILFSLLSRSSYITVRPVGPISYIAPLFMNRYYNTHLSARRAHTDEWWRRRARRFDIRRRMSPSQPGSGQRT